MLYHMIELISILSLNSIPLHICITYLFSHSSVDGHLGCCHLLTIVHIGTMI